MPIFYRNSEKVCNDAIGMINDHQDLFPMNFYLFIRAYYYYYVWRKTENKFEMFIKFTLTFFLFFPMESKR